MSQSKKRYLTAESLRFTAATKAKICQIMEHNDISRASLSRGTGIPDNTLKRWLSSESTESPTLPGLAMIADYLGCTVRELLADARIRSVDEERYQAIAPFYTMPLEHVRWLYEHYRRGLTLLRRK